MLFDRNSWGVRVCRRAIKTGGLTGLFLWLCVQPDAQPVLSERTQISLLTCSPSDRAVYTLYGHTAVRVHGQIVTDSVRRDDIDIVFNYGVFDTSRPNFIYHFARGETDYMLAYDRYGDFLTDYIMRGSEVFEQTLNLTPREKETLWQALLLNAEARNRNYRYNFFYDNCSTRPVAVLERCLDGEIQFHETPSGSFREMINRCTRDHPWLTFGCDLVLGLPTDRTATFRESFFLPENVRKAFTGAEVLRPDGERVPLVSAERVLVEEIPDGETEKTFFTPLACSLTVFLLTLSATLYGWRKKRRCRALDGLLFFCAGVAGCILFFLCFVSEHPGIRPNLSVGWLHPFHLAGVVLFAVKKLKKAAYYYHFINFAALLSTCCAWIFLPQHLNMAFIPLAASLLIRSGYGIFGKRRNIG
ncbi:MAG: DUF4105 domain-containing protein [Tannerella sp.]|jgi:hypothetical protein|nr:DUF4105 domain-containing protein [Tannerella sp.]